MKPVARAHARAPFRVRKTYLREAVFAALASIPCFALANPVGGKVVAGSASIQGGGNTLTVRQATDRAVINWQGFSIGAGELTKFVQPGAGSAVLNRVVTGNPSALLGRLEANGKIFLINPNGILVGGGAVINTQSFIASTLDVSNAQFMAGGNLNFVGSSTAGIKNLGKINANGGDVFLIAHSVENAGTIVASGGVAGLAAGNDVLLRHAGDERLFVRSTVAAPAGTASGVNNSGVVTAVQAELKAAAGNVYGLAVNNSGAVHATGIVEKDGRVLLTSGRGDVVSSGTLSARNADGSGGTIVMTGERVALKDNALVDVSGEGGGGTALIGGDLRGGNPLIANAQHTLVGRDARIIADALSEGDGGKVIVWADRSTVFNGAISARGGARGGDGGFAEVSGKTSLAFNGTVDLGAPAGQRGTLLLDPKNSRLRASGTATPGEVDEFSDTPDQDKDINPAVLVATNADVVIQANNDITFESSLQLVQPGASITAQAGRGINVDSAVIIGTNNGPIRLIANENAPGMDPMQRDGGSGGIGMHNLASINSGGADVLLHVKPTPDALTPGQFIVVSTINAGTGKITLRNEGAASNPGAASITQTGNGLIARQLEVQAPGQIFLTSATNAFDRLVIVNNGPLFVDNSTALVVGDGLGAGGPVIGRGDVRIRTLTGDLTLDAPSVQPVSVLNPVGSVLFDAGESLIVNGHVQALFFGLKPDMTYRAMDDVTINAGQILARNLTITATNGNIMLNVPAGGLGLVAADIDPNGIANLTAGGSIMGGPNSTITARTLMLTANNGAIDLPGIVNTALLNANAAGNITINHATNNEIGAFGAITSGGDITITDVNPLARGLTIAGLTQSTKADGVINVKTSGNVQFLVSANCRFETGPDGRIVFDAAGGQILDGATPSFIGGSLLITGRAIGGGTSNPLNTQVSRLAASVTAGNNFGGFMFLVNNQNAPGNLAIGGLDPNILGVLGDGRNSTGQCVSLVNNGSILIDQGSVFATNPGLTAGRVSINAMGGDSDVVATNGIFGVAAYSDSGLNVTAGRDVLLGQGTGFGSFASRGGIDVNAGRNVILEGPQIVDLARQTMNVTAANMIAIRPGGSNESAFRSTEGGRIALTANSIDLDNGSATNPVVRKNESGAGDGSIDFVTDNLNIGGRVDAGSGPVTIVPRTNNRPIALGNENPAFLSLQDAELDRINAGTLAIGGFATTGPLVIDQPITRSPTGPTYNLLELLNVGDVVFQSTLDLGNAELIVVSLGGNLQGRGNITAATADLFSANGSITLSGALTAQTLTVSAPGGSINLSGAVNAGALGLNAPAGNVFVDNDDNNIVTLTGANYNQQFRLRDSVGGMSVTGFVDGGADSTGQIEVRGGNLVLQQGAKVFFGGPGRIFRLYSDTGFVNLAGPDVLVPENGGRWLIYAPSPESAQLGGLTAPFTFFSLSYPEVPATNGNVLVFESAQPAPPPSGNGNGGATPPPQNFRLFSSQELTEVERLIDQIAQVGDIKFDFNSPTTYTALDAMDAFFAFRDSQYENIVSRINGANLPRHESNQMRALLATVDYKVVEANRARQDFFAGKTSLQQFRRAAKTALEALDTIQDQFERISGERAVSELLARAERAASGEVVLDDDGRAIVVPGAGVGLPSIVDENGLPVSIFVLMNQGYSLGSPVSPQQINAIVAAGGGNLSQREVNAIVAAGGYRLTPGVIAGIVAAGGGNFGPKQIANIVAAGGGNLSNPFNMISVLNATIVAARAGNIIAAGAGNIVASGGGNIVAAGGLNLVAAGGLNLVASGGLNLTSQTLANIVASGGGNIAAGAVREIVIAGIVAGGGGNLIGNDGGTLIGNDGGSLIGNDGGSLIGNDGGSLIGNDGGTLIGNDGGTLIGNDGGSMLGSIAAGIVAGGGGNMKSQQVAGIVAGGGGNFNQTVGQLVAGGAGNLVQVANIVAGGGGNLQAGLLPGGAAGLISTGFGSIANPIGAGSSFVNSGGSFAVPFNPGSLVPPGMGR